MASTDKLATLVQSLPAELYSEIDDLTFLPTAGTIDLTTPYRLPNELQVDRASRKLFARRYYHDSIFTARNTDDVVSWLLSLRFNHFWLPREVRLLVFPDDRHARSYGLRMTARQLRDAVDSGPCLGNYNIRECGFLRVQDKERGELTPSMIDV